jgi:hypothetical protein
MAWGLVRRRAIKVPDAEVIDALDLFQNGLLDKVSKLGLTQKVHTPTMVLERRPPSPSIQTSVKNGQ